jgi:hypothetical protein
MIMVPADCRDVPGLAEAGADDELRDGDALL